MPHDSFRRFGAFERSLGMGLNVSHTVRTPPSGGHAFASATWGIEG